MLDDRQPRREATTSQKVVQVLLGVLVTVVITLICLGVLVILVKEIHFQ